MLLVKLGGSVITDKSEYATFRNGNTRRLMDELRSGMDLIEDRRLVLVHGAGSFGHILAHEHNIDKGIDDARDHLVAIPTIKRDLRRLNSMVEELLIERGFHPVTMQPEVILHKRGEGRFIPVGEGISGLRSFLDNGFLPVLYGDVVSDDEKVFSICSGDDIINALSLLDGIDLIIFVTDVHGIYRTNDDGTLGEMISHCTPEEIMGIIGETGGEGVSDVTGGMWGKARAIADMARRADVWVINGNVPGRLKGVIEGKKIVGTIISSPGGGVTDRG